MSPPTTRDDLGWAVLLGLAAFCLYHATPIERIFGDGSVLISLFAARDFGEAVYIHALYLPAGRGLAALLAWLGVALDPASTLVLLSQVSAALGVAATLLVARGFGLGRMASGATALLVAVSPPVWFFADVAEVHALHFAAVATVAALTLHLPWRRPVLATGAMAVALPLVFLTHQSGLLLYPGWVLLADLARRRVAPGFGPRVLFLGLAPVVATSLAAAVVVHLELQGLGLGQLLNRSAGQVEAHLQPGHLAGAWSGWLRPLALLWLPLGLGVLRLAQGEPHRRWTLATLLLPSLAFFLAWGVPERGAYSLGGLPFLAVVVGTGLEGLARRARGPRGRPWPAGPSALVALLAAVILLQAGLARREVRAFERPDIAAAAHARRAAAKAAFSGRQTPYVLLSLDRDQQTVTAGVPDVRELDLAPRLVLALNQEKAPTAFAAEALALAETWQQRFHGSLALDRSYTRALASVPAAAPFVEALEAALAAHFTVEALPGPGGGVWLLGPRVESGRDSSGPGSGAESDAVPSAEPESDASDEAVGPPRRPPGG